MSHILWGLLVLVLGGCAGMGPTTFIHPEYNFAYAERVAVVPFENLSGDQGAAARVTRYFIAEMMAAEAFDVVEPGEVAGALQKFAMVRTADLTREQMIELGRQLNAQALFFGSVAEVSSSRAGSGASAAVTLVVRMVETETGSTVWSTTHTESPGGFWSSLFGTSTESKSELARRCVERSLRTLIN